MNSFTNGDDNTSYCIICNKPSVSVCNRCGDYYCSPRCQHADWHKHRYICFPMPSLVLAKARFGEEFQESRPKLSTNAKEISELEQSFKANMKFSTEMKQEQMSSIAQDNINTYNDNKNAQGQGPKRQEPKAMVPSVNAASNHINNNNKNAQDQRPMRQEPKVVPASQPTKTDNEYKSQGANKTKPVTPRMQQMKLDRAMEETHVMEPPFKFKRLELGSGNFKAFVLDTSCVEYGYIGCLAEMDFPHFTALHKEIGELKISDQPYSPILNEFCIAKFEDIWYRAKVLAVLDKDRFNVLFIDFTNELIVSSDEIRRYPLNIKAECRTDFCYLDGLPEEISRELGEALKKGIEPQSLITIDSVKSLGKQLTTIQCNAVLDQFRQFLD